VVRRIVRSARADEDLIEIWLWIARDDPAAADRVLDAIAARWSQLAEHPLSGPARDDIQPGLRHLVAGRYLIVYRVVSAVVRILRVLHGRRSIAETDVASAPHDA
jgi:toxin ParE1/3/4